MNVSSKVTLYDMLAMVIPGFLLLLLFQLSICGDCCPYIPCCGSSLITGTLIFIASYVVGLIYNKISFTNIKWILDCLCKKCYLFDKIAEYVKLACKFRNNPDQIKKARKKFDEEYKENINDNVNDYYKAYYFMMEKNCLNNIPVLEAQVAFLRNMIPVVLLYIIPLMIHFEKIFGNLSHLFSFAVALVIIAIAIVMYRIMVKIQDKIYFLVWEGNEYLKEIQTNHHE